MYTYSSSLAHTHTRLNIINTPVDSIKPEELKDRTASRHVVDDLG